MIKQPPTARLSSLVRFNLKGFELDDQGAAALFGLQLAQLVLEPSYPELMAKQREIARQTMKSPGRVKERQ